MELIFIGDRTFTAGSSVLLFHSLNKLMCRQVTHEPKSIS